MSLAEKIGERQRLDKRTAVALVIEPAMHDEIMQALLDRAITIENGWIGRRRISPECMERARRLREMAAKLC